MTHMEESQPAFGSAKSELLDALKAVPSAAALSALWFILLAYVFNRWAPVDALSAEDRAYLAFILAVPLALVTYYLGNYWDDRIFDPRYTEDPLREFRGKWLDTTRRNCFGLLPAGRNLDQERKNAAAKLNLPTVEGVYAETRAELQKRKQWALAKMLLVLSKLCRSLIWPSFLVAAGLMAQAGYGLYTGKGASPASSALGALVALGFGLALFVPYINLRVEHMREMYRRIL